MALDGATLSYIRGELAEKLDGARIDRVQQPAKDELLITLRRRAGGEKLLISASSNYPRAHLTAQNTDSPLKAPMFCMLLRKHLGSAKFVGVSQPGLERILFFDFDCRDEFGDIVRRTLVSEIMGRHSNIILLDGQGVIIDAIKRVDASMSSLRQVLPGMKYELPPRQDKTDLTSADPKETAQKLRGQNGALSKLLIAKLQGVSPIVCRELAQLACRDADARAENMTGEQCERLAFFIGRTAGDILAGRGKPVMLSNTSTGKPMDFSFMDITQYGTAASSKTFGSFSQMLDTFYRERDRAEQAARRSHDILAVLTGAEERVSRKIAAQRAELDACADRERLKLCGDILSANIYRLESGMSRCELENFYAEGSPKIVIELDPRLTPAANAQRYYRGYRREATREKVLTEQITLAQEELEYLDSVFDELSRAGGESELMEIRDELAGEGYIRHVSRENVRARARAGEPLRFVTDDGFTVTVGRNNRENDTLTLKKADRRDIWFHTKNIPGSHVIITTGGREVPETSLRQAAELAAWHSKAHAGSQVPVDWTLVKNVKKPNGAKPGMVIYVDYSTVYVTPDPELASRLRVK
jgi:predicted ribosome quality control (RQC) complex YloA/Tae2 family protein